MTTPKLGLPEWIVGLSDELKRRQFNDAMTILDDAILSGDSAGISAALLTIMTTDGDIVQNVGGAVVRRPVAQYLASLVAAGAVDLTSAQTITGAKTVTNPVLAGTMTGSGSITLTGPMFTSTSGSVSKVAGVGPGLAQGAFALPAAKTMTFTMRGFAGSFAIQQGGGQSALVTARYAAATAGITVTGDSIFVATASPSSSQIGIFKSSNSQTISVKNGTTGPQNVYINLLGDYATAVTDPA